MIKKIFSFLQDFITRKKLSGLIIALISFLAICLFSVTDLYENFELRLYDLRFRIKSSIPEWEYLSFIDINDKDISNIGKYPWPRHINASAMDVLTEVGINQMTYDIEFPDHSPDLLNTDVLKSLLSKAEKKQIIKADELAGVSVDNDRIFAQSIKNSGRVILPYNFPKEKTVRKDVSAETMNEILKAEKIFTEAASIPMPLSKLNEYSSLIDPERKDIALPIPELVYSARAFGFVDRDPDADGTERRIRLVRLFEGRLYFEMGLVMLMDMCGVKKKDVIVKPGEHITLQNAVNPLTQEKKDIVIPIDEKGKIYINWAGPGPLEDSFFHVPFYMLLEYPLVKDEVLDYFDEQELSSGSKERSNLYGELDKKYAEFKKSGNPRVKKEAWDRIGLIKREIIKIENGYADPIRKEVKDIEEKLKMGKDRELEASLSDLQNYLLAIDIVLNVKRLRDQNCIIGLIATGTQDLGVIPIYNEYMMVGTYHNVINTVLNGAYINRAGRAVNFIVFFALAVLMGIAVQRMSARVSIGIISAAVIVVNIIDMSLFCNLNFWIDQLGINLAVFLPSAAITAVKFMSEESQKRYIKNAFSRYLSPGVIDKIIQSPEALELGGAERTISIFFSDVEKFSTISEKLTAPQLVKLLNEYLSEMTDIILSHGGTVDKYIGDAIVAFYGAPHSFDDHALRCVNAAIDMKKRLRELQDSWRARGENELKVRMGMNTGIAVVGNMGSRTRMDYTAMGDTVNLASRLEGANKYYQTYAMLSSPIYDAVKDHVEARKLDKIKVVGKDKPIVIYELLNRKGELPDNMLDMLDKYSRGLEYFENRDWKSALASFKQALKVINDDGPSLTYVERCENFIKKPPPRKWDGIYRLSGK